MAARTIRIGTRDSKLALWQATQVDNYLKEAGYSTQLVPVKSDGDLNLVTPLYEMGVQGIFTRNLDIALLQEEIDIAVHSMKDVPVVLPKGIVEAAVLARGNTKDILVYNPAFEGTPLEEGTLLGTSSIRRKAQWINRYGHYNIENLRGNVQTRLRKLEESNWIGAIFAAAGLERVELKPASAIELDWMLPAPAQGAVLTVCREGDAAILEACRHFHHPETAVCVKAERDFLRTLMGGCAAPIGALAEIRNGKMFFQGNLLSVDGAQKIEIEDEIEEHEFAVIGKMTGEAVLNNGGREIMEQINRQ